MSLTYGSQIIAEFSIEGMSAKKCIGAYQICISACFSPPMFRVENLVFLEQIVGRLYLRGPDHIEKLVGIADPEIPLVLNSKDFSQSRYLFEIFLTSEQLWLIEGLREGGDLTWSLEIAGIARGDMGDFPIKERAIYQLSVNKWSQILDQLEIADVLVLGVSIPKNNAKNEPFLAAFNILKQAHKEFNQGMYDTVVSKCRKIIESIEKINNERSDAEEAVKKFKVDRRSMTKKDRELLISETVRHYTHLANHVDSEDGIPEWYGRNDAIFVLTFTTATLMAAVNRKISVS